MIYEPIARGPEPPRLPLDRDVPRQWMDFHLADGRACTSRQINWRNVPLGELVAVQFNLKGEQWRLSRADLPSTFREFVVFRTGGSDRRVFQDPRAAEPGPVVEIIPYNSWTLGWTDWGVERLDEFSWKTGAHLRRYELPRDYAHHPDHFHPQSRLITSAAQRAQG